MTAWVVTLDPPSIIPGRTELNLNSGLIQVSNAGIDWGESSLQQYMAEQRWGQSPVDYRVPNRVVTIPLAIGMADGHSEAEAEAARRQLQEKVALIQREQGVLKRQRAGGEPLYADIVNATLTLPDVYAERGGGIEPNVSLVLECLPDFYGEEIALDAIEETGQIAAVLKQSGAAAVIAGDYPARCRVVLTEKGSQNQRGAFWGFRSRHYDAASTAALFYDAYSLTLMNGATTGTESGTFSGKAAKLASPEREAWHPFLELKPSSGARLTHLGSYRVWARIKLAAGQRVRLAWAANNSISVSANSAAETPSPSEWALLDLGEVRLEEPPVGEHAWAGVLQVETGEIAHEVAVDRVWLQPTDEVCGTLLAPTIPTSTLLAPERNATAGESSNTLHAGTAWTNAAAGVEGPETLGATVAFTEAGKASQALVGKTFGFSIPSAATIHGIEVQFPLRYAQKRSTLTVQMLKAGAAAGTAKAVTLGGGQTESPHSAGGPSDLWGTTWTPAQIEAAGFGFFAALSETSGASTSYAAGPWQIRVYYSLSSSAITQDAVLYSTRKTEIRTDGCYREDPASTVYASVSQILGDLPRLPPSGTENREVQLLVKNSRGVLPIVGSSDGEADTGIDKLQAQVFYRPCYIGRI